MRVGTASVGMGVGGADGPGVNDGEGGSGVGVPLDAVPDTRGEDEDELLGLADESARADERKSARSWPTTSAPASTTGVTTSATSTRMSDIQPHDVAPRGSLREARGSSRGSGDALSYVRYFLNHSIVATQAFCACTAS